MKTLLRTILPPRARRLLVRLAEWLGPRLLGVFASTGLLASLYYLLFSREFDREHRAVLRGRLAYFRSLRQVGTSSPRLRRNTHRLEKGLIMRPRRPVFAEGYILETVRSFSAATNKPGYEQEELHWARDVLDEYFTVVEPSPVVAAAHHEYKLVRGKVPGALTVGTHRFTPYPASSRPCSSISFADLSTLFARRRSVRWYQAKPVPADLISKATSSALLAPSACNRQPFRFIVATGSETSGAIAACAGGTAGFAEQIPAIVVVVGDLSAYPHERDRHLIYIDASLAAMQLMLAAETLGLATCPINWPDIGLADKCMLNLLNLEAHERVIMLVSIGYAQGDGEIPYSSKKGLGSTLQWLGEK